MLLLKIKIYKKLAKALLTTIILLTAIITKSNCGLPSVEFVDDLNAPKNLSATRDANGITITFWAYNPESNFWGYNIYIGEDNSTIIDNKARHINSDRTINEEIEKTAIIKNESSDDLPTIKDSNMSTSPRTKPALITYTFTKKPDGKSGLDNVTYHIAVSAYDKYGHIESGLSEIIEVDP